MQLKAKISLINVVSIILSVAFAVIGFIVYFSFFTNPTIRDYYSSRHHLFSSFDALKSRDDLDKLFDPPPADKSAVIILDTKTRKPILSYPKEVIKTINENEKWSTALFIEKLSLKWGGGGQNGSFYSESIINKEHQLAMIYFSLKPKKTSKAKGPLPHLLIFTGLSILFASVLSMIILQKTGTNIKQLEKATHKIAEGNLDFEFTPKGSDEISRLAKSFNVMRLSLKEEQAIRNRFLMGVSHDLKTPLTTIEGYLDAIKDGVIPEHQFPSVLDKVQSKSKLLESRIMGLIDYVKMETGEWRLSLQDVNLDSIIRDLDEIYSDEIMISGHRFKMNYLLQEKVSVSMDIALFIRLFENLINNAIKYSEEGSLIQLNIRKSENSIQIEVKNEGAFMDSETKKLIFEPFYRAHPGRNAPGFGLGLSIVKSIVDAHGWKLSVESEKKCGTSFIVSIIDYSNPLG